MKVKVQGYKGNQSSQDRIAERRELLRERTQRSTEGLLLTPSRLLCMHARKGPEVREEPSKGYQGTVPRAHTEQGTVPVLPVTLKNLSMHRHWVVFRKIYVS